MEPIIAPVSLELIKAELTPNKKLRNTNKSHNEIYVINHHDSPNVMREIGRLREEAFRDSGGGSGLSMDIDEFDTMDHPYQQLIVWDPEAEKILGGYRFILGPDIKLDANGEDLNAQDNIMLLSITTRLGLNVSGLEFLGSKTSAKIEADFAGFGTSNTVLRIRQAYAKMDWEHSKVLVGQAWHPAMGDMMPDVFSLETGAPFTPFSRTPQIRYDYETKNVKLTATALYQFQYTSYGPKDPGKGDYSSTGSFDYARNAIIPEMYFQGTIKSGGFMMGLGVDVLTLKPRTQRSVTTTETIYTPVVDASPATNSTYFSTSLESASL